MKTNVSIELTDSERSLLADLIDGKQTQRLIKRAEVVALCRQHIGGLLGASQPVKERHHDDASRPFPTVCDLYTPAPEDAEILKGKEPGYIRGWNLVKRSSK